MGKPQVVQTPRLGGDACIESAGGGCECGGGMATSRVRGAVGGWVAGAEGRAEARSPVHVAGVATAGLSEAMESAHAWASSRSSAPREPDWNSASEAASVLQRRRLLLRRRGRLQGDGVLAARPGMHVRRDLVQLGAVRVPSG